MVIIKCKRCKLDKSENEFRLWRNRRNKWCDQCRLRNNKWYSQDINSRKTKAKLYYQRTKNKVAEYRSNLRLDRKYSLTREEWNDMFTKQKGLCGICKLEMKKPCVDHNHKNGKVRGLLHRECNLKLQSIENVIFLKNAQSYLDSLK